MEIYAITVIGSLAPPAKHESDLARTPLASHCLVIPSHESAVTDRQPAMNVSSRR